ncbi:SepM family pheromone-processing serine protease [Amphibacillus cookii]|uniref:SepM family pheromone-processing serine protease n=1 Tax=Amphibacillus cookii TaxID=767787 RepID=UPI00195627F6|nr:SepM family pheromone-processing serine protease [Amphibacillus cookii]MBM7540462.1 PDZ domain-containing protein [Amphibacillus cookii]
MYNFRKKLLYILFIIFLIVIFVLPLPYYIYKPGTADPLNDVVKVDNAYQSEGDLHLVTVRGGRATPIQLLIANLSPYEDIHHLDEVFPEGYDRERYLQAQLQLMESSQEAAMVVAYQEAGEEIDIHYEGVYVVSILEDMPAEDELEIADKIIEVENVKIIDAEHLIEVVNQYQVGDELTFLVDRDGQQFETTIELVPFAEQPDQFGIGIQLVTNREVDVARSVDFASGDIGGPSAGLVLALELFDQLTPGDLTKGLQIAGTGEIDYDGNIYRIGGVDKKVIAADREGCDIFFVPNEQGAEDSNYNLAKETAEAIGTDMEIVPIDHFEEAVDYLQQ